MIPSFEEIGSFFNLNCYVSCLVDISEEDFLIFKINFPYFVVISWGNLNPFHRSIFCAKLGCKWPTGSREEDFQISSMYFCNFIIIIPWKRAPSIEQSWISLHTRINSAKFSWNWPSGSVEEENNMKSLEQRWQQRRRLARENFRSEFSSSDLKTAKN